MLVQINENTHRKTIVKLPQSLTDLGYSEDYWASKFNAKCPLHITYIVEVA